MAEQPIEPTTEGPYWVRTPDGVECLEWAPNGFGLSWWRLGDASAVSQYEIAAVLCRIPTADELQELREKAGIASMPVEKIHSLLAALANTVNVERKYAAATLKDISDEASNLLTELTRKATT